MRRSDWIGFVGNGCRNAAGTVGRQTACEATHKGGRHASNHKALATLTLGLALVGATTATAAATPPTATPDQADQVARKALYQSELERNLATAADRTATRPSAQIDPAPNPGVDVVATLLIGLVGGLAGGAAAMIGWTATTRRRRPRAAAGT